MMAELVMMCEDDGSHKARLELGTSQGRSHPNPVQGQLRAARICDYEEEF